MAFFNPIDYLIQKVLKLVGVTDKPKEFVNSKNNKIKRCCTGIPELNS